MIAKQNAHTTNKMLVTFVMPAIDNCACLYLVGKFGDWNESVYRMQRAEDGTWFLALELDCDSDYQYRYRTDKGIWYDDLAASEYMPQFNGTGNQSLPS